MSINFFENHCQTHSNRKTFGVCDDPPPDLNPAYIDEFDGHKWIAVVMNDYLYKVTCTGIDNCILTLRANKTLDSRCDAMLSYNDTVVFVELKQRTEKGNGWIKDADLQLRTTIGYFKDSDEYDEYPVRRAYIANSMRPRFRESQQSRMNLFEKETGFILRIENRISLT